MTGKTRPLLVNVSLNTSDIEDILHILSEHERNTDCISDERMQGLTSLFKSFQMKAELEEFYKHIDESLPAGDDEEEWSKFYNKYWNIRYGGKAIVIDNNAGIYNSMLSLIKEQLDDYL